MKNLWLRLLLWIEVHLERRTLYYAGKQVEAISLRDWHIVELQKILGGMFGGTGFERYRPMRWPARDAYNPLEYAELVEEAYRHFQKDPLPEYIQQRLDRARKTWEDPVWREYLRKTKG